MRTLRHALRLGMPPVVALALLTGSPGPAFAEDERPFMLIGEGDMTVYVTTDRFRFCVVGNLPEPTAQIVDYWYLNISGVRATEAYQGAGWTASGPSVSYCESVYRTGYSTGEVVADFGYVGAAGYVVVHSTGGAFWNSLMGPQTWHVDFTA